MPFSLTIAAPRCKSVANSPQLHEIVTLIGDFFRKRFALGRPICIIDSIMNGYTTARSHLNGLTGLIALILRR